VQYTHRHLVEHTDNTNKAQHSNSLEKTMHSKRIISLAALVAASSSLALAAPDKKEKKEKDLLRGPKVTTTDSSSNSKNSMMNQSEKSPAQKGAKNGDQQKARPISFRDYQGALRALSRSADGNSMGLTDSQSEQIKSIMADHREAMKAFQEEHKDTIATMRQQMKDIAEQRKKESATRDSAMEASDKSEEKAQRDARARQIQSKLRNFIDNAPPNKESLNKLKQVLSADQATMLNAEVKKIRANRESQMRQRRQGGEQGDRQRTQFKQNDKRATKTGDKSQQRTKREKPSPVDD
jgi:hypothetical protein